MEANHYTAKVQKRNSEACGECGHHFAAHLLGGNGCIYRLAEDACECAKFRKARSATRRSTKKYAAAAERKVAEAIGGRKVRNQGTKPGDVDVETDTKCVQVKHMKWSGPLRRGMEQVLIGATPGKRRLLVWVDKPGQGRQGQAVVCELLDEWTQWNGELEVNT